MGPNTPTEVLSPIIKVITQADIHAYAMGSGDLNPVHLDASYAEKSAFGGIVAHGMLLLAYISQMLTQNFGLYWIQTGRLAVRFHAPARPGDTITTFGEIRNKRGEPENSTLEYVVGCLNQHGEELISGKASISNILK